MKQEDDSILSIRMVHVYDVFAQIHNISIDSERAMLASNLLYISVHPFSMTVCACTRSQTNNNRLIYGAWSNHVIYTHQSQNSKHDYYKCSFENRILLFLVLSHLLVCHPSQFRNSCSAYTAIELCLSIDWIENYKHIHCESFIFSSQLCAKECRARCKHTHTFISLYELLQNNILNLHIM